MGPVDLFEEDSLYDNFSADWNDPNDRGFESDESYDQGRCRMAADDPNNVRLSTDKWAVIHLN